MTTTATAQPTDAEVQDFVVEFAVEATEGKRRYNDFIASLYGQICRSRALSPKQLDAARRFMVKEAEFQARKADQLAADADCPPVPSFGGVEIKGEIVAAKWKDGSFGYKLKLTVKDDRGFRVYGNCPDRIADDYQDDAYSGARGPAAIVGKRIAFTANTKPSDDNPAFGYFSRPRKVTLDG